MSALTGFEQTLTAAIQQYFPQAATTSTVTRNIILNCRVELDTDTLIAVYFNALTGKTSYALIAHGQRIAGYDNYKFWHYHPAGAVAQHIPCPAPTPATALQTLHDEWVKLRPSP